MVSCFVCYYHEILLKKGNRGFFERVLWKNTQKALQGIPYRALRQLPGRLIVELLPESPVDEIGVCLQKVVGILNAFGNPFERDDVTNFVSADEVDEFFITDLGIDCHIRYPVLSDCVRASIDALDPLWRGAHKS